MPSLDGYSLNQKIDKLHDEVQDQLDQLKKDFHNLYGYIQNMEKRVEKPAKKQTKKETVDA